MQHLRNRRKQKRLLSTYLSLDKMFTRFHHFHSLSMSLSHSSLSFTHPHTFLHWQTFASLANCSHIVSIVTRLDDFWKLFVTNFLTQVAQMYVDFLGSFENIHYHVVTFWATFGKFWATLYFSIWSHCTIVLIPQISDSKMHGLFVFWFPPFNSIQFYENVILI